jgi:hypothetical protein
MQTGTQMDFIKHAPKQNSPTFRGQHGCPIVIPFSLIFTSDFTGSESTVPNDLTPGSYVIAGNDVWLINHLTLWRATDP